MTSFTKTRPAWIEVNLDNIVHNIETIEKVTAEHTHVLSIVKSDGYKFGAVKIVEALREAGVSYFGVATMSEAVSLRNHFDDISILILGYTPDYLMEEAIEKNITMATYSMETAKQLSAAAKKLGKKARIHLVVDSGMNRIGFKPTEESLDTMVEISKLEGIDVEGLFTHFAVADSDEAFTKKQFKNYCFISECLRERGVDIRYRHVSNSHAIMRYREFDLDFVRPGVLQYGSKEGVDAPEFDVRFIAEVKAEIGHLKTVGAGEGVSYGLTYTTEKETKIATLPLGYADGIPRLLSNKIDVLVGGKRCPQIGRICMDQFMIDVTGVDCKVGDEVVIVGKQGEEEITIEEISAHAGEIPTSFVTHFNKRLPKVYLRHGEVVAVEDLVREL